MNENRARQFVSPYYILRVGGLPLDVVDDLVFEESLRWAEEVSALEGEIREGREALLETLHAEVRESARDPQLQRALIVLKRDIFNTRPPKDPRKAAEAVGRLSPGAREGVGEWLSRIQEWRALREAGRAIFQQELEGKRARLKSILSDESFRMGLLLASPTLERDLRHYLEAPGKTQNRRLRLAERAALLYLYRTACKTSPFSTLGPITSGRADRPSPPPPATSSGGRGAMEKRSFVQLNATLLSNLSSLIQADREILKDLPLSLKEGWDIQEDRVRYVRRVADEGGLGKGGGLAKKMQQTVTESVFYLPLSPTLRRLIEVLGGGGERTLTDLIRDLGDGEGHEEQQVEEFLLHLLRLDFLVARDLQLSLQTGSFLADYRGRLARVDNPKARLLCQRLEGIERLIDTFATARLERRRELLTEIEEELKACYAALGQEEGPASDVLLYEDATVALPTPSPGPAEWGRQTEGLKEIQLLMPLFNASLRARLVMNAYFKVIYGEGQRCDDVLSFAETFTQDYFKEYRRAAMKDGQPDAEGNLTPSVNHFNIPAINALDSIRQDFAEFLGLELLNLPAGSTELRLSRESLRAFTARIPQGLQRVASNCILSQAALTDDGLRLVINLMYSGFTQMFSRFMYPFEQHGSEVGTEEIREILARLEPPGAVFALTQGAYDTNLNIHPQVTSHQLVCPGDRASCPPEWQIPLGDLYIEHDPGSDTLRLYSRRLGKEVMPLYLGYLLPMALPHVRQVLLNFSYFSFGMPYFWSGVNTGPKIGNTFAFYPRLCFEEIVLQRAMWKLASEFLPRREASEGDADYFLKVKRWREQCGLPRYVFVTPDGMAGRAPAETNEESEEKSEGEGNRGRGADKMMTKPMFVDFDSYFSVMLLENAITRSSSRLVMTEMLPGRDEQWLKHDGRPYVSEFIFEVYQEQGGAA